jgi:hypothetical protein
MRSAFLLQDYQYDPVRASRVREDANVIFNSEGTNIKPETRDALYEVLRTHDPMLPYPLCFGFVGSVYPGNFQCLFSQEYSFLSNLIRKYQELDRNLPPSSRPTLTLYWVTDHGFRSVFGEGA